jgi:GT2 family glycosyltransferase
MRFLEPCLDSLRPYAEQLELIVVDNGSTDGSLEYLRRRNDVRLLAQAENLGYARANNLGIEQASGDYVLLLNNDTVAQPGFLAPLLAVMEANPGIGAGQSKMLTADEPHRIDAYGSYLTSSGFLYHHLYDRPDEPPRGPFEVFSAKGAAVLIRRDVLQQTGSFDADFFAYLEDSDLSWRIWLAGFRVVCVPESVVLHRGGATASALPSELVFYHSFKNRVCMLLKNLSPGRLALIMPLHLLLIMVLMCFYLVRGRAGAARGIARALAWNFAHLAETLGKRRWVQASLRRVSDSSIWPAITRPVRLSYYYYLLVGLGGYRE